MGWVMNGGWLVFNADFTYTDTPSAGFSITDVNSGGILSNGAPNAWRKFKSASSSPSNPWTPEVIPITGYDSRFLQFDYIEFRGCKYYLGNTNYYIYLNDPALNEYLITEIINPAMRENRLAEHPIKGRTSAIVFPLNTSARSMTVSGRCKYTAGLSFKLDQIIGNGKRIAFFSRFWHLPKCWIDGRPIINSSKNAEILAWNLVLREDV
jgi:hypothetical protein